VSRGAKTFIAVLVFGMLIGGGYAAFQTLLGTISSPPLEEGLVVTVEVTSGMGATAVADMLEERGVIRSATAFRLAARGDERANRIQAGVYELVSGMSTDEILDVLAAGPPPAPTFRVTIPEGLTVGQTLERLATAGPHDVATLQDALAGVPLPEWVPAELPDGAEPFEGLLFPNTYEFLEAADPQSILARLVEETERVVERAAAATDLSRYETLVMASLIEREARIRAEQELISSVMHNRLARNMRLEIDATVLYALGEHRERVLFADLEVDSPWNTYRYAGLPPTPISGAGEAAILAAGNPAETEFLFYVVIDPQTGEHGFSRTFEEHQQKIREARG
jgi:UPF0755 protein